MKKYKIIFFAVLVGLALFGLGRFLTYLSDEGYKNIISHKKMYCYQTYGYGQPTYAMYITDIDLADSLKQYYKKVEKGNFNAYFNFQPHTVPLDTCVYVLGYNADLSIAKIEFYYGSKQVRKSVKGYVYTPTLHEKKPDIKKFLDSVNQKH